MVFIDLRKAYDAMDRGRCLEILEGYGVGPNIRRLLSHFWEEAELVCRASGRYGAPFKARRGVTQGGPISPRIFNLMVDAIVREWLRQVLGDEAAAEGYGDFVRDFLSIFYADDAVVAGRDVEFVQESLDIIVDLFERVGLRTNTSKTVSMACIPGRIRTRLTTSTYHRVRAGMERTGDWRRRKVTCDICDATLSANSLDSHLQTQHGVFRSRVIDQCFLVEEPRRPVVYKAVQAADGQYFCPVPGCPGSATRPWTMRLHFARRHIYDRVYLYPKGGDVPEVSEVRSSDESSCLRARAESELQAGDGATAAA